MEYGTSGPKKKVTKKVTGRLRAPKKRQKPAHKTAHKHEIRLDLVEAGLFPLYMRVFGLNIGLFLVGGSFAETRNPGT